MSLNPLRLVRSLRGRLLGAGALASLLVLGLAWWLLARVAADFVAERFDAEQQALAQAVMAGAGFETAEPGPARFVVDPQPADPRFAVPRSGWVWQVSDGETVLARSPSLLSADLGVDGRGPDAQGRALDRLSLDFTAPGDGRSLTVTVGLPAAEQAAAAARATGPLAGALALLALLLLGALALVVRWSLAGIGRLQGDLQRLGRGEVDRLPLPAAAELRPLAEALNGLLDANRGTVARSRAHVGNLAHALKAPLAVLANRAREEDRPLLAQMERSVRWHLRRAQAIGPGRGLATHTPLAAVRDDLAPVFAAAAQARGVVLQWPAAEALQGLLFTGEHEDLVELLGNPIDNALRHAKHRVRIEAGTGPQPGTLVLTIADDGPGIPAEAREALLERGVRGTPLDEAGPSGLGLAITADLVALYGGRLELGEAPGGGLRLALVLPGSARGDSGRL